MTKEKHVCHSKLCKICYTSLPPSSYKHHSCVLKQVSFPEVFNSCIYFDIECIYEKGMTGFHPLMITSIYENILFGNYNMITFAHDDLIHQDIGKIHRQIARYDYTGTLPNRIGESNFWFNIPPLHVNHQKSAEVVPPMKGVSRVRKINKTELGHSVTSGAQLMH